MKQILQHIVNEPTLHARWLNTLSFLENCGARLIAQCEHPTLVTREVLKHAAEEFRHAHYLKQQIARITDAPYPNYTPELILGGFASLHYLKLLNSSVSRHLLQQQSAPVKVAAYILVTYAIECRAKEVYPIYDQILRESNSRVTVKSILLEEEEHLSEMVEKIQTLAHGEELAKKACQIEASLYQAWTRAISRSLR